MNLIEICSLGSNWQLTIIGSDNGLSLNRRQPIIWTNDGVVCWSTYASLGLNELLHWGRVMHICISKLAIIGSDNGLSPGWRQAIIWINVGILLIRIKLQWNRNRNLHIFIQENAFESVVCKMAAILSRPQCVMAKCPQAQAITFTLWPLVMPYDIMDLE